MTPAEVAAILTAAKALDDRVTPDAARVQAWSAVLAPDLTVDAARAALIAHYGSETRVIMPADLNTYWRAERRRLAERAHHERLALEASKPVVPMPPEVREQIQRLFRGGSRR